MKDMYNLLTKAGGNVQILGSPNLGDPAMRVDLPQDFVKYAESNYTVAEEINLGFGRFLLAQAPSTTQGFSTQLPAPNTSLPYMVQRVTIPSSVALFLMIDSAKIAATQLIDGESICADVFSEVSLNNGVRWPTAQTGQQISLTVQNTDDTTAHEPRLTLTGIRLRN